MSKPAILDDYLELVTYGFTNPMPDSDVGPWKITAKDVIGGEINFNTARRTTQEAFDTKLTKKSRPKIGDVLLTKDGTLGRLAIVQQEGICINQSVAVLRPNEKILPEYLFYLLSTPEYQRQMIGDSDGTVIKHIYITRVGKMEVDISSIEEQRERLKHLLAIDGKIKLNRQTNQTLEQIAQTIFKSWFVDFEPVKAKIAAKQNGQSPELAAMCAISGKTEEQLKGLDEAALQQLKTTAALFPDALVESELGEIPEGWGINDLSEMCSSISRGVTPKYEEGSGFYAINQKVNKGSELNLSALKELKSDLKVTPEKMAFKYDVLVNSLGEGTIGRVHYYNLSSNEMAVDQHMTVVRAKEKYISVYLYAYLSSSIGNERLLSEKTGSTNMTMLNVSKIRTFRILSPENKILDAYGSLVISNFDALAENVKENSVLTKTRDLLLPKLLSSEIPFSEAI